MFLDAKSVWLTESFCLAGCGKILPIKHGQRTVIAAHAVAEISSNLLKNHHFFRWHGFRF
jgi:hypothetical protein